MTFKQDGFRPLYKNLSVFPVCDEIKTAAEGYPGADNADCALMYGYIDITAGLTLEILAFGRKDGEGYEFFDGKDESRAFVRIDVLENTEFFHIDDGAEQLAERYAGKLKKLELYDVNEDQDVTRFMTFLDGCRHEYCVDNVIVKMTRKGLEPENIWTRIIGIEGNFLVGILQTEPGQNFGVHKGEKMAFFLTQDDDGKVNCEADLNPTLQITPEDLADGSMLKNAIDAYTKEKNQENTLNVLEILRDSRLRVMCSGFDLIPDLVKFEDKYYFPVFTSDKEMGERGKGQQKIVRHIFDCFSMARKAAHEVSGLVVNPFTVPFVLDKSHFEAVERMPSSFVEE